MINRSILRVRADSSIFNVSGSSFTNAAGKRSRGRRTSRQDNPVLRRGVTNRDDPVVRTEPRDFETITKSSSILFFLPLAHPPWLLLRYIKRDSVSRQRYPWKMPSCIFPGANFPSTLLKGGYSCSRINEPSMKDLLIFGLRKLKKLRLEYKKVKCT